MNNTSPAERFVSTDARSPEISPPPKEKCKECFSFGVAAESARRCGGAFVERTILVRATTRSVRATSFGILLEVSPNFLA